MAKELILYFEIYDFIAADILAQIEENISEDITLRLNSPGGNVFASNGIFAKIKEHGNIHLKVDGAAMSMMGFASLYCKSSECLDVSRIVLHRADMYVDSPESQAFLDGINKDLKAKFTAKVDAAKFKEVTKSPLCPEGHTINELFDPAARIDIALTGKQAVQIGLIDKVTKLTPVVQKELTALNHSFYKVAATVPETPKSKQVMDLNTLKTEHSAVYAQVFELGKTAGSTEMKGIAEVWGYFAGVDPKAVAEGIKSGIAPSPLQIVELTQKQFSVKALADIGGEAAKPTPTAEVAAQTAKDKATSDFVASIVKNSTFLSALEKEKAAVK